MKKILLSVSLLLITMVSANAQAVSKGDKIITLGIGFENYFINSGFKYSFLPLNASLEYCFMDNLFDENSALGIGGYFGYASSKLKIAGGTVKQNYTTFGAKGYFHYNFVRDLDTYGGLMLGYNSVNTTAPLNNSYWNESSSVTYSLFVGARYFFTDNIGAFAEIGYGVTAIELGVAFRF